MRLLTAFALFFFALGLTAEADIASFKKPSASWSDAFSAALTKSKVIRIPKGKYTFSKSLVITSDVRLIFSEGAHFEFSISPGILLKGGTLRMEADGAGAVLSSKTRFTDFSPAHRGSVIDLNYSGQDSKLAPASLIMRNMELRSDFCIDGSCRRIPVVKIGALDFEKCRFISRERHVDIFSPMVESVRVVDCTFTNGNTGLQVNAAIPKGAVVTGNILRNIGRVAILLGKSGQIAEGCTKHLPNAIVHDNQILKGGHGAGTKHSYIHGILVYGHNVSVQGNIVRDFNRGVPVPGARAGHQIIENGKVYRERFRKDGKQAIRLAGAAIYLKANRAIVHSNICTNSGWRSVIEIKTGGKEYYTSVVNNVVDGKSLAIDESFAFECGSGRSLWANNVVYDVPHQAFAVRSGYENSFMNNVIVNAKVGFALSGWNPGQNELINGNRFINVEYPVALESKTPRHAGGLDVHFMPPSHLSKEAELPEPSRLHAGRMIMKGNSVFYCVNTGSSFEWMELAGKKVPRKKWRITGPELALNADQSGKGKLPQNLSSPVHPGWSCYMRSANEKPLDPNDGHITFDTKNFLTGGRSLKFLFKGTTGEFTLRQPLKLTPGKRYRAFARVKGEEPRNWYLQIFIPGVFSEQTRGSETQDWQTLTLDFTLPANSGHCVLVVRGAKTSEGKSMWLDSVSVRELQDDSAPVLPQRKSAGSDLLTSGKTPAKWSIQPAGKALVKKEENNIFSVSTRQKANVLYGTAVSLKPEKEYRFALELLNSRAMMAFPSVKIGSKNFSAKVSNSTQWQKCEIDFKVPAGSKDALLRIWAGNVKPGEFFRVRNISLKELE